MAVWAVGRSTELIHDCCEINSKSNVFVLIVQPAIPGELDSVICSSQTRHARDTMPRACGGTGEHTRGISSRGKETGGAPLGLASLTHTPRRSASLPVTQRAGVEDQGVRIGGGGGGGGPPPPPPPPPPRARARVRPPQRTELAERFVVEALVASREAHHQTPHLLASHVDPPAPLDRVHELGLRVGLDE